MPEEQEDQPALTTAQQLGVQLETGLRDHNEEAVFDAGVGLLVMVADAFDRIATALEVQTKFLTSPLTKAAEGDKPANDEKAE